MKSKTIAMLCLVALTAQGGWLYQSDIDPIYDRDLSFVATASTTGTGFIGFKMLPDGLNLVVGYERYFMGSNGYVNVEYRFDREPPVGPVRWQMISDQTGAFAPMSQIKYFKHKILTCKTLAVRVTDRDGESITMIFDLTDEDGSLKTFFRNHDKGERQ